MTDVFVSYARDNGVPDREVVAARRRADAARRLVHPPLRAEFAIHVFPTP